VSSEGKFQPTLDGRGDSITFGFSHWIINKILLIAFGFQQSDCLATIMIRPIYEFGFEQIECKTVSVKQV